MNVYQKDCMRYEKGKRPPVFQKYYRLLQTNPKPPLRIVYKFLFNCFKRLNMVDLSESTIIGEGLYFGHPYGISINRGARIGKNANIHKGVTIGQENRGSRKGVPSIGDNVWIGINSTIVGNVKIGNDVLIAPNTYVNCDVKDHSIVLGNPCMIKHRDNATEFYINRMV